MRGLIILLLFFIASISLTFSQSLNDGLIAYWSFDDSTANDFSGNGYNGTLVNGPVPAPGVKGSAFRFQGYGENTDKGSHILLPYIDFNSFSEFTISMWVNEEGMSFWHGGGYIFFGDQTNGWLGIWNHFGNEDNDPSLKICFTVGDIFNTDFIRVKFDTNNRNKWMHYCMVYRDGITYGYINGDLVGSLAQTVRVSDSNAAIARCWWNGGSGTATRFTGRMDEVRIYNRALTGEEVKKLYKPEVTQCSNQAFNFAKFDKNSGIALNRDAQRVDSVIKLTPASINRAGSVYYQKKLPLSQGFSTQFTFRFREGNDHSNSDGSFPGADGIALVIQNESANATGNPGGGIGYEGIANSVAVEFDTYKNDSTQIINMHDPNGNHAAVMTNGKLPNSTTHLAANTLAINDKIITLRSDGTVYHAKIEYLVKPNTLAVYLDDRGDFITPVLEVKTFELDKILSLEDGKKAFIGITSATGNACQTHEILGWEICLFDTVGTGVDDYPGADETGTADLYPNPFTDRLTISYQLEENSFVELKIFDMLGRQINTLVSASQEKGQQSAAWNADGYENGLYYYTLTVNNRTSGGKMILGR